MTDTLMRLASAGAVAALMTAPVFAQDAAADWDADASGTLTQEEFDAGWGETGVFDEWDADDDDLVDEAEFDAGFGDAEDWADADIAEWDADETGDLTEDEFGEGVFAEYDADETGDWNEEEWALFQDDVGEEGFWDW